MSFEGIRDLQPFFDAAMEAGIYLIARPGPYVNAETSKRALLLKQPAAHSVLLAGGGFPGWGTYEPSIWRTSNASYVEAYQGYMAEVGGIIAKNQITNGGPVILVQVSSEAGFCRHN